MVNLTGVEYEKVFRIVCLSETWEREEGMLAYCLFETYGFPLVFAVDEMERYGMPVDEAGFHIMTELARQRNKNTFKGKDAFG